MNYRNINTSSSVELYNRAKKYIPGGVNSPVRSFKSVSGNPIFIKKGKGAYLTDEDDNDYIDYINSWGPMILGHAFSEVVEAIKEQVEKSMTYGTPTRLEVTMAELIHDMTSNIEMIRMVNSGTEACMSALRVARGYTGRNKFIKFDGCYHGHADMFLVNAGSGAATLGIQSVPGVSASITEDTLTASYNDLSSVQVFVDQHKDEIAAIIIEPVAGNMGCVLPADGFLEGLRKICDEHGIVLIFDEVMTGFRLAPGGAQELYNIQADLVTYGKIIGGGLPVGAFGGRREIMECVAPLGKVYQAGTLSGNPLAMAAGYSTLYHLNNNKHIYADIENTTAQLKELIGKELSRVGIQHRINQVGSMMSVFFSDREVTDFNTAKHMKEEHFRLFFHHMLDHGIYLPPSPYESWFISAAIKDEEIEKTIHAVSSFTL